MIYLLIPLYALTLVVSYYAGLKYREMREETKVVIDKVSKLIKRREVEETEEEESVVIDPDDVYQMTVIEQRRKMKALNPNDEDLSDL